MTQAELEQLIRSTESERLEKATSLTNTDKFSEAVCAFANDMALTFDVQPCQEALLSDLTPGLFETYRIRAVDEETIAANHRTLEAQMASLRLFSNRFNCPTNAGVVLLGRKPRYFFPGTTYSFYCLLAPT